MKWNKEKFLGTEFGKKMIQCAIDWDKAIEKDIEFMTSYCSMWEVFQLAVKQFYGIEYHFTRTDEYFGICTEDETDWLLKIERK